MNNKKIIIVFISMIVVMALCIGVTYAFFNYQRVGVANSISVGSIHFNTSENGSIDLTKVFPIDKDELATDTVNSDSVVISITGDTTYSEGIEYVIYFTDVSNTVNNKKVPISFVAEVEDIGGSSNDYYNVRGGNTTVYTLNESGIINNNRRSLVGYIKPGSNGISGRITITAFLDMDTIAVTDTYDGTTLGTSSEWVADRTVFTTSEWSSITSTGLSFKVKVEAKEGTWVTPIEIFGNKIKNRLGLDGLVAVNSNGDLYSGTGTIREYRYSGIGNYCTYTDGTNNYNVSVEGTTCPEHAYKGSEGYLFIGSSDGEILFGLNGEDEFNRVSQNATISGLKNYVSFNNEMWRIIGVFGDNVKIMKDLPLTENVTSNPVDTVGLYTSTINGTGANNNKIYTNKINEQYLIKNISFSPAPKYGYFYFNGLGVDNYESNWNDWTQSGLMYYLNEENTGSYYSTINANYKKLIDRATYYLGNITIGSDANNWWGADGTAKEIYEQERGNVICSSSVVYDSQNSNCNVWYGSSATWSGKIGLMYPSDYGYATSTDKWNTNMKSYYNNDASLNSWMFNNGGAISWTISPSAGSSFNAVARGDGGDIADRSVFYASAVRPVLYLKSNVEVSSGDGSYNNPYILNIE